MDHFTKLGQAYAILYQKATAVVNVLIREFISHSGVPLKLQWNKKCNFKSEAFHNTFENLGACKTRTTGLCSWSKLIGWSENTYTRLFLTIREIGTNTSRFS